MRKPHLSTEWQEVATVAMDGTLATLEIKYHDLLENINQKIHPQHTSLKDIIEKRSLFTLGRLKTHDIKRLPDYAQLYKTCNMIRNCHLTLDKFEKQSKIHQNPSTEYHYSDLKTRIEHAYRYFNEIKTKNKGHSQNREFISDILPVYKAIKTMEKENPFSPKPKHSLLDKIPLQINPSRTKSVPNTPPSGEKHKTEPKQTKPLQTKPVSNILPSEEKHKTESTQTKPSSHHYIDNDIQKLIDIAKKIKAASNQVPLKTNIITYKALLARKEREVSNATIKIKADTRHWKEFLTFIKEKPHIKEPNKTNINEIIKDLKHCNNILSKGKENLHPPSEKPQNTPRKSYPT